MKKLIICGLSLMPGGAERVISILSRAMAEKYDSVELLIYYDREIAYDIDPRVHITIVERKTGTVKKFRNALWIRNYLKKQNAEVLSFLVPLNIMMLGAAFGLHKHIIVADRNDPKVVPKSLGMRIVRDILYRTAWGIVAQTEEAKNYLMKKCGEGSYYVIPNPTSISSECKGMALQNPKKDKIVCVGRLIKSKNPDMLLKAFLNFQKVCPGYELWFYGDGDYRKHILRDVEDLRLQGKVFLAGNVVNVSERIKDAKAFVTMSDHEGMSNALIEAMCIGLPCITTDVMGARDLIKDGVSGIIIRAGDTDACAKAMQRIAFDDAYAFKMGQKASELTDRLSVGRIMKKWEVALGIDVEGNQMGKGME